MPSQVPSSTKRKLSRVEFDRRYWKNGDPDTVPESTKRSFYSDYKSCHHGSFAEYVKATTRIE